MSINFQMKIAICDDDEKDRCLMQQLVTEYLDIHNYHIGVDTYLTGEEFLAADMDSYSLVILDIFMGRLNGIETAKELIKTHPQMHIIFWSTSNAYAAESYDVSALRYFIKPISREKLFGTLDRFFHVHTALKMLTYKKNRMDEHLYVSEILWVEAGNHCSIIHTKNGQIQTRTAFGAIYEQLQGADFVKPIRYALVALDYVTTIPADSFTLVDGTQIPISRDQRAQMKKAYTDYKMRKLLQRGGIQ